MLTPNRRLSLFHPSRHINLYLALIQGFYWAANCVLFAFLVPLFQVWGYNDFEIGVLTMLIALSSMVAQPLWGMYIDREGHLKAVFLSQMVLGCFLVFLLPYAAHSVLSAALVVICLSAAVNSMANIIDAWSVKLKNEGEPVNYSLTRSFGSLFFATTAVGFGITLDHYGDWIRYPAFIGLVVVVLLVALGLQKPKHSQVVLHQEARSGGREAIRSLGRNKKYVGFILSVFIMNAGGCVSLVFFPLMLSELGGNNSDLGLGWFVMAFSEFPILILFGFLVRKVAKVQIWLAIGMVFFGVKTVLLAYAPNVGWAIALQGLEGLSYGLYLPAAISYINEIVDRKSLVTAQMVLASVYGGLGPIFGNFVGGFLSERYSVSFMMLVMGCLSFVGSVLFIVLELRKRERMA